MAVAASHCPVHGTSKPRVSNPRLHLPAPAMRVKTRVSAEHIQQVLAIGILETYLCCVTE